MSLLTPDAGLLFWMILSFGIVFVILSKYGFPVIIKAVEQRKEYIDRSLESARQANEQLADIQAEGEKILAQAREQQNRILLLSCPGKRAAEYDSERSPGRKRTDYQRSPAKGFG